MITRPLPFSPYRRGVPATSGVRTPAEPGLIPFVIQREGEEAAPANLVIDRLAFGRYRLRYQDEDPRDRDLRGVLIARCAFNPVDERKMPTGTPQWKMMHPHRQIMTMQAMRCQVCAEPARTPLGYVFLSGSTGIDPERGPVLTNQPPVCAKHVRAAVALCPHLRMGTTVFLARSAPLYGVSGVLYGYGEGGVQVVASPDEPLPYGHPNLSTFLASQLLRRLSAFRVLEPAELLAELAASAG
ncbi:hypothetical protein ABZ468_07995 [Streptomyces sp. NPDC005708]|uniref:hypothetical protein n=1 Tax=Streptomyces sp. NPDC005708 TaxID=3154564 RepID=UPI0034085CCA